MARFSTAQKETLRKMAEEGKLATSQLQNIMRNAQELKKLNRGGVVGFQAGGMPEAPGSAPTPVQDPGEFKEGDDKAEYDAKKAAFDQYKADLKAYQGRVKAYKDYNLKSTQELAQSAIADPTSLVTSPDVDTIDPNTAGTTLAAGTGQITGAIPKITAETITAETAATPKDITTSKVTTSTSQKGVQEALEGVERDYKQVSAAEAGFLPPPGGTFVTQAFETFHNPTTGEVVTVNTGGYTAPEGFVKGKPQGKFKVGGVKAAKGTVSDKAQITAAEGELSPEAMAEAQKFDADRLKLVAEDPKLQVTKDQLAEAKGKNLEAVKAEVAESETLEKAVAETAIVQPEELPPPAQIAEDQMAQAQAMTMDGLTDDATAVAVKLEKFTVDDGTLALAMQGDVGALDTVEGQLSQLMKDFDDGTPAWAAGAIRAANAAMASRGLGASSMAGAAILQAAMESALPIAQQDAATFASMNMANLNNRQQTALTNAAAQQGLQLQNLSNEQQTALANSSNAFALQSQNLSNMQSTVIANAQIKSALQGQNLSNQQQSNLAIAARFAEVANLNLSNKQQTALQNNSSQLQTNLANLSSKSQAYITNANLGASLQGQVLSNEQQVAISNAARFSEASNITFSAEQQTQLHNSSLMQTIGLAELSSAQAATLQNAAKTAGMDIANLSNRQQAAVENARAFLQMDLTNLSNEQQTAMFKAQATQQAILSDTAAENAAKQFNASSENQTNQFMANLKSQTEQFNAAQKNAVSQFNAGQKNAAAKFNTQVKEQRNQFNATNALVVAQANAQWKQNVTTLNTAAQNQANAADAAAANAFTSTTMDQVWQRERDLMDYAYKSSESDKDRALDIVLADKKYDEYQEARDDQEETSKWRLATSLLLG